MILRHLILAVLLVLNGIVSGQGTQTIRGTITDKEFGNTLVGATVILVSDTSKLNGTTTDIDGNWRFDDVPLGRHAVKVSFMGYRELYRDNILLTQGKEVILNLELEESTKTMKEVEITATGGKRGEVMNEMSSVSARAFTVEETDRYAGSRGDPARMASNFAGVSGTDDGRNDIVVRGNSPLGILYRVEGVQLPNPNHFAISGSQGGPIGMLNNKVLANSDFFTGAFPAEFGNSTSAAFDLRLRNGNNQNHELSFQFGIFGTELLAEGPINKEKRSSYLVVGRYATLEIFHILGINIGTDAVPRYKDASFKLNFPGKKNSNLSIWGIGGNSSIDIVISDQEKPDLQFFGENDRDQYFRTGMGTAGITWTKSLNQKTYLKATVATSQEYQRSVHDYIIRHVDSLGFYQVDSLYPILGYRFRIGKHAGAISVNQKLNVQHSIKFGITTDYFSFDMLDSVLNPLHTDFINRWDYNGGGALVQPYVQWKFKASDDLVFNAGVHSQYFSLSNSLSAVEPRVGMRWDVTEKSTISAGFGVHSQIQPLYTYLYHQFDTAGNQVLHNINMDMSKSNHYVLGYDQTIGRNMRLKLETYYQNLYNIPVEIQPSSFSLINQGSGFARFFPDSLQNTGTGQNMGVELTVEKFFSKSFFFMVTASLYDSKYKGSDGIERNTDYNGNYVVNGLVGKEFSLGEKSSFNLGAKVTWAGGKRYGIVDVPTSTALNELVFADSLFNEFQFPDYFRFDVKMNYRSNAKKVTHEVGIDLVNLLGTENILSLTFYPDSGDPDKPYRENYQLGFLPVFYYRLDF